MKFTDEQQAAIDSAMKQNTYIVAGAGSGKSTTLAEIARLTLEEDPNNRVLLITFTNKSARDIIDKVGGKTDRIDGGTFHSVAYRMMRKNGYDFNICDTSKQNMIIKRIFDVRKDKEEFERIKNEISITKCDYPQRSCEYTVKYNTELQKYNMYDFDDIIFNGIEFIKEVQPEFAYTHVLVDELQDTAKSQLEFLKQIHEKYDCRMIGVGDISQSIYEWRGARPENVNDFIKTFDCQEQALALNFRSKNNIVECSRKLIENNSTHKKIDLRSFDRKNGIVQVCKEQHPMAEIDTVVTLCKMNRRRNVTILYRDRLNKMKLEFELRRSRLNYKVNDSTEIVDRSAFRVYIAMMKIASRDYDIYDMEIVAKGLKALGTTTVESIKKTLECNKPKHDKKGQYDLFTSGTVDETDVSFHTKVSRLADGDKKIKRGCIQMFKLQSEFKKIQDEKLPLSTLVKIFPDYMIKSFEVPKEISDFLEDIAGDYDTSSTAIKELCNNFGLDGNTDEVYDEDAKIQLSTIHGFKGGEDDVVILPFCDWKFREDDRVKDIVESERRLFYVAVTRPKNDLYLTYSGFNKPRFITEMGL